MVCGIFGILSQKCFKPLSINQYLGILDGDCESNPQPNSDTSPKR